MEGHREVKEKIDLKTLTAELSAPKDRLRLITGAEEAQKALNASLDEMNRTATECEQLRRQISEAGVLITVLSTQRQSLESAYKIKVKICDALSSLNDKISEMREGLAATETCPLCGTRHVHFVGEEAISAQIQDARNQRDRAKEELDACDAKISQANVAITTNTEILRSRENLLEAKRKDVSEKQESFTRDYSEVDLSDVDALAHTKADLQTRMDKAQQVLDDALAIIKQADDAQSAYQKCDAEATEARKAHDIAMEALTANSSQQTVLSTAINVLRIDIAETLEKVNDVLPEGIAANVDNVEAVV